MDFTENYFELFQLEPAFQIDKNLLLDRYREIQKNIHPDKFVQSSDHQKRLSLQYTSLLNEAYSVLSCDFSRALYLLKLTGIDVVNEHATNNNAEFLMEQMLLRERLSDIESLANPHQALEDFAGLLKSRISEKCELFNIEYNRRAFREAHEVLLEWQFLFKLQQDLRRMEDRLF